MSRANVNPIFVHLGLVAVQFLFGGQAIAAKRGTQEIPGVLFGLFRNLWAIPLFFALSAGFERGGGTHFRQIRHRRLMLLGFLAVFLNQVLIATGVPALPATSVALLTSLVPVYVAIISIIFFGDDQFSFTLTAGLCCALFGVVCCTLGNSHTSGFTTSFHQPGFLSLSPASGAFLITSACIAYATYIVLLKRTVASAPPFTVNAWTFLYGEICIGCVALLWIGRWDYSKVDAGAWASVAYSGICTSVIGYSLMAHCSRHVSPLIMSSYALLQPITAGLLSVPILGEFPPLTHLFGGVFILTGLCLVNYHNYRASKTKGSSLDSLPKMVSPPPES